MIDSSKQIDDMYSVDIISLLSGENKWNIRNVFEYYVQSNNIFIKSNEKWNEYEFK